MNDFDEGKARDLTLSLLADRAADSSVCLSEVARTLAGQSLGEEWRRAMPVVHAAVDALLRTGAVRFRWKGKRLKTRFGSCPIALFVNTQPLRWVSQEKSRSRNLGEHDPPPRRSVPRRASRRRPRAYRCLPSKARIECCRALRISAIWRRQSEQARFCQTTSLVVTASPSAKATPVNQLSASATNPTCPTKATSTASEIFVDAK